MNCRNKNYVAFSLWGDNTLYTAGMLKNIALAKKIYPGWQVIVYYDNTVPSEIMGEIEAAGALIVQMSDDIYGMFWRFLAADLEDCNRVIFRDSDSRLSKREYHAVNEWISEDHAIHIMRDHPYHLDPIGNVPHYILGGMWGIKGGLVKMREMINHYNGKEHHVYGSDQIFLNQIYHQFENSATIHDEFFSGSAFPVKRSGYRFIGERFDIHERPMGDDWRVIKAFYQQRKPSFKLMSKLMNIIKKLINIKG
jgi:hypothetical protein